MPNNKIDSQATPDTGIGCVQAGGTEEVSEISSQRRKLIKALFYIVYIIVLEIRYVYGI